MHDTCTTAKEESGYSHGKDEEQQRREARQNGIANIAHQKLLGSSWNLTVLSFRTIIYCVVKHFRSSRRIFWVAIFYLCISDCLFNCHQKLIILFHHNDVISIEKRKIKLAHLRLRTITEMILSK